MTTRPTKRRRPFNPTLRFDAACIFSKREGKLGLGSAYKEGFRWAMAQGFDTCIQIDADLSHDPADIPRLLRGA